MPRVSPHITKINEVLASQVVHLHEFDEDQHHDVRGYFDGLRDQRRQSVEPVIQFLATANNMLPGFIIDLLAKRFKPTDSTYSYDLVDFEQEFGHILDSEQKILPQIREHSKAELPEFLHKSNKAQLRLVLYYVLFFNREIDYYLEETYEKFAGYTKWIPDLFVVKIAEVALTPFICARIANHLEDRQAGNMVKLFKDDFLGELVPHMNSEKVARVIPHVKINRVYMVIGYMISKSYYNNLAEILSLVRQDLVVPLAQGVNRHEDRVAILTNVKEPGLRDLILSSLSQPEREDLVAALNMG